MVVITLFPDDFPNKGKYRAWTNWSPSGCSDEPQYPGQQPIRFPEDASPYECHVGGYLSVETVSSEALAVG